MNRLLRRTELVANICIIAVALVICAALVKRFLLKSPSTASPAPSVATGTKITLPDVDWAKNGKTLLLVLSTGCRFCSASAPFYQHLASKAISQQGARLIAVLPQGVEQSREYLKSLNVTIDDVEASVPARTRSQSYPNSDPRQQCRAGDGFLGWAVITGQRS